MSCWVLGIKAGVGKRVGLGSVLTEGHLTKVPEIGGELLVGQIVAGLDEERAKRDDAPS